jgi:hypothetical protein
MRATRWLVNLSCCCNPVRPLLRCSSLPARAVLPTLLVQGPIRCRNIRTDGIACIAAGEEGKNEDDQQRVDELHRGPTERSEGWTVGVTAGTATNLPCPRLGYSSEIGRVSIR